MRARQLLEGLALLASVVVASLLGVVVGVALLEPQLVTREQQGEPLAPGVLHLTYEHVQQPRVPFLDFDACGTPSGGHHPRFVATCETKPGEFIAWAVPDPQEGDTPIAQACPAGVTVPIFRLAPTGDGDEYAAFTWREEARSR